MSFPEIYKPVVTAHATLEWLQRVHGLDVADVHREILADGRAAWVAQGVWLIHVPALASTLVARKGRIITVHELGGVGRYQPQEARRG